mmetsp:Transcript_25818/g.82011  ORF Transcript_25818/g.82011 Transcript_25818/m.82011 type:complete len:210 (+) Transcript_25818:1378-2007(+)
MSSEARTSHQYFLHSPEGRSRLNKPGGGASPLSASVASMRSSARPSTAFPFFQASAKLSASMACARSRSRSPRRALIEHDDALTASSSSASLSSKAASCSSSEKRNSRRSRSGASSGAAGASSAASGSTGGSSSGGAYSWPWPWSSVRTKARSSLRLASPSCSCERLRVAACGKEPSSRSRSARPNSGRCLRSCCRQKWSMWYLANGPP